MTDSTEEARAIPELPIEAQPRTLPEGLRLPEALPGALVDGNCQQYAAAAINNVIWAAYYKGQGDDDLSASFMDYADAAATLYAACMETPI